MRLRLRLYQPYMQLQHARFIVRDQNCLFVGFVLQ